MYSLNILEHLYDAAKVVLSLQETKPEICCLSTSFSFAKLFSSVFFVLSLTSFCLQRGGFELSCAVFERFWIKKEKRQMEEHILRIIILGIISWATAFRLLRKFLPKRSFEFCNRLVSTVHATLAFTLASLSVEDWTCPVCPPASKPSPSQMQTLAVSLSYLIYDLICCQFDKRVTIDNTIHHLVSIVGIGAGLAYGKCGSELIAALCITEMSSPFLHLRELLKELGYGGTDLNLVADISFAAVFSFARMGFGPCLTWVTLTANNPLVIKAMAVGLQMVSAYWFYKIARMMNYKLTKRVASKNLVCTEKMN